MESLGLDACPLSLRASWSTQLARAAVAAIGLAFVAQFIAIFRWDEGWIAITLVTSLIACAYCAPRLSMRSGDQSAREALRIAWQKRMPWLFAPWILGVVGIWSFRLIPWHSPGYAPGSMGSILWRVRIHECAYWSGVALCSAAFVILWRRAPVLAGQGFLAYSAFVIITLTALSGFVLLMIITLAVT